MLAYIAKRLLATIPVMAVVAIFVFALLRLTPGDPGGDHRGLGGHHAGRRRRSARSWASTSRSSRSSSCGSATWPRGDFGESFFFKKQVAELVGDRIEPTLMLVAHDDGRCRSRSRCRWA